MPDWRDAVPANLLITAHKNGGILLGAFTPANQMIGFAFSFLGTADDTGKKILKHCSHMLAVLPEYQRLKLGERLKFAQRQAAVAQGVRLMTWTFDPLLALNANLNLVRLGAIVRHYIVNAYGEMSDALNAGLPSDRFEVEWWMNAPRVLERLDAAPPRNNWDTVMQSNTQPLFDIAFDARGLARVERVHAPQSERVMVEIPANINSIKAADAGLAVDWRMRAREMLLKLFGAGYIAVDFVFARREPARAAYLLTRQPLDRGA